MKTLVCEFSPFNTRGTRNPGSPGQEYHYLYTGSREVNPGDYAIVHNGHEFGLVTVSRVMPGVQPKVTKHIIALITQEDFSNYQKANGQIVEHRKVFDQLDYMLAEEKRMEKYRELAERNPEAAKLLQQATTWQGQTIEHQAEVEEAQATEKDLVDVPGANT